MKKEELLKSISNLLKKHEDFLNENPEVFYAIEDRFFKAVGDDEPEEVSWEDMQEQEPDFYDDEEDYGQKGYGDDVFDRVPSEDYGEEQDSQQGELDEADQWLAEQEGGPEQVASETRDNLNTPEAGTVQQEIQTEQPEAGEVDVHPDVQKFLDEGYHPHEAERFVNPKNTGLNFMNALNRRLNVKDPSPKMLEEMKGVAKKWLSDARKNTSYDPKKNPQLHASGKTLQAHEEAHSGFSEAYNEFLNSDDLKGLSRKERRQAIRDFKEQYHNDNPDYKDKAVAAADSGVAFSEAAEARKQELMDGFASLFTAGQSNPEGLQGYSAEAAGLAGEDISDQAAAQMVGAKTGDEGYSANIKKNPAAIFAEQKPEALAALKEQLKDKLKPEQAERLSAMEGLKGETKKELKEQAKVNPLKEESSGRNVKTVDDKGLQMINDHLIDFAPLINIKSSKLGKNAPDHVEDGDLLLAGMHGLIDAFHTYDAKKGASFKSHAGRRIEGKMMDFITAGGANSVDKFFYDKAKKIMQGSKPEVAQPAASTAGAVAVPQEIEQPKIENKKPEGVE